MLFALNFWEHAEQKQLDLADNNSFIIQSAKCVTRTYGGR